MRTSSKHYYDASKSGGHMRAELENTGRVKVGLINRKKAKRDIGAGG